jgi:hypothetical protein
MGYSGHWSGTGWATAVTGVKTVPWIGVGVALDGLHWLLESKQSTGLVLECC